MLSEHWRTFQELLMTSCEPIEDLSPLRISRTFQDIEDLCEPDYLQRTLRTLINFWGLWGRLEYLLRTLKEFEEFEDLLSNLRIIWGPEGCGRWGPFVHVLDILRTLWTFCGLFEDLRTWCSQNIEELFRTFWWLRLDFLSSFYQKPLRNLLGPFDDLLRIFWQPRDFEDVESVLRTLCSSWIPFADLWGLRGLWWPFGEFEDILRVSWGPEDSENFG